MRDSFRPGGDAEEQALLAFLTAQRDAVLSIVAGLDEDAWHRPVVPPGWTPAGLVEHLGGAEWHWFRGVVAGKHPEPVPGEEGLPAYDPTAAFVCDQPSAEIVNFYRGQCSSSDAVIKEQPPGATLTEPVVRDRKSALRPFGKLGVQRCHCPLGSRGQEV